MNNSCVQTPERLTTKVGAALSRVDDTCFISKLLAFSFLFELVARFSLTTSAEIAQPELLETFLSSSCIAGSTSLLELPKLPLRIDNSSGSKTPDKRTRHKFYNVHFPHTI